MSIVDSIYQLSPVAFQNALITSYGYLLKRLRYGQHYHTSHTSLKETAGLDEAGIKKLQEKRLHELVKFACKNVRFYTQLKEKIGFNVNDLNLDNYRDILPIITKDQIKNEPEQFLANGFTKSELTQINTSGTTGAPLIVVSTKKAIQENYAFFTRFLETSGVGFGMRNVTFAGRMFVPENQQGPPFWRFNKAFNSLLCSSYHLNDNNIPDYVSKISKFKPVYIDSYPSSVYSLAKHIDENRIQHNINPKAIITSSETLLDHQRELIERIFSCKVYDQYGSAEMAAFISECSSGSYHIAAEYGLIEMVDENGDEVSPGEQGELVCTGFLNYAMPLIRYKIGDSAILSKKTCSCGYKGAVVDKIIGRTDDVLVTPEGNRIGRLDPVYKGLSGIVESQIIQLDLKTIIVKIVPQDNYTNKVGEQLRLELSKRMGPLVNINIELVDRIPRTNSGKFRSVISNVK